MTFRTVSSNTKALFAIFNMQVTFLVKQECLLAFELRFVPIYNKMTYNK